MVGKSEIRDDGTVSLMVRHRQGERAVPDQDAAVIEIGFSSRDHMARFLRTFERPDDECYYDMRGFDLSGLDLTGANLPHVHLAGADLTGTILRDAQMPYAWLRGAVMDKTDMTGADATKARVDDQVFSGKVISASDTFNTAVNKPTRSEKKAQRRMAKQAPVKTPGNGMRR